MNQHQSPRRLLDQAGYHARAARDGVDHEDHVSLIRTDILAARELLDLALHDLENQWEARGRIARETLASIEKERRWCS